MKEYLFRTKESPCLQAWCKKVPPRHDVDTIFVKGASHCAGRPRWPLGRWLSRQSPILCHHKVQKWLTWMKRPKSPRCFRVFGKIWVVGLDKIGVVGWGIMFHRQNYDCRNATLELNEGCFICLFCHLHFFCKTSLQLGDFDIFWPHHEAGMDASRVGVNAGSDPWCRIHWCLCGVGILWSMSQMSLIWNLEFSWEAWFLQHLLTF